jgi:two-component system CheB/CheR fusion protein
MPKPKARSFAELRALAEKEVTKQAARRGPLSAHEAARLVHELDVYRVELEMQNEELRHARLEAEQLAHRYATLFDFAPVGYLVLDALGVVREANLHAARMLGVARGDLVGQRLAPFVAAAHRDAFEQLLARVLAAADAGAPNESQDLTLAAGAEPLEVRATGSCLAGPEPRAMIALVDLTPQRRAESALRQESHRKDEFMAVLSHELRNPLAPIRSSLAVLERTAPGQAEGRKAMEIIDRQVKHLVHVVDDLLDVTRIAHGKVHLKRQPVELGALVRREIEAHRPDFGARGIALEGRFAADDLWVDADETRIVQVLDNLLANALKFTHRGGHVRVTLSAEGGRAVMSVRDDGVGIAPEVRARLFEPFTQALQTLDRSLGGLGLGLAMVKGLVELHGGSVEAISAGTGQGSEFVVRLPMMPAPARAPAAPAPSPKPRRYRVLVIEDSVDCADAMRDVLRLDGHDAQVAYDGPSGLALARSFHPEIVFCDIGLPEMDGYEVARAMRGDDALRASYLVALSGYARPEDRRRSAEAGFDYHLAKPPSIETIERVIADHPRSADAAVR